MDNTLNITVVGLGTAGVALARRIAAGDVASLRLAALCDRPERLATLDEPALAGAARVGSFSDLLRDEQCDIVAITTPHVFHAEQAIAALRAGKHVFCEKPLGVSTLEARRVVECVRETGRQMVVNFNRRLQPVHRRLRELLQEGSLGPIRRVAVTVTNWYRPNVYFTSSPWRATWVGEGGGLLLNQAPHNLDLLQWVCGLPSRVRAFCGFGRHHAIEVEDDVTAYLEFPGGATGTFTACTGEAPGVDRFEISTDRGLVRLQNGRLELWRTAEAVAAFTREADDAFAQMPVEHSVLDAPGEADLVCGMLRNLVESIQTGQPLVCPAQDALGSLELANAMLLSSWQDDWVNLPMDAPAFDRQLRERQRQSALRQTSGKTWSLEASLRMEKQK